MVLDILASLLRGTSLTKNVVPLILVLLFFGSYAGNIFNPQVPYGQYPYQVYGGAAAQVSYTQN